MRIVPRLRSLAKTGPRVRGSLVTTGLRLRGSLLPIVPALSFAAALSLAASAHADTDVNPPMPNVLLLLDTSGSMEFQTNGSTTNCAIGDKSRWINLIEVLTGGIENYGCTMQDRTSAGFKTTYTWGGTAPYDADYYLPYHQPTSGVGAAACGAYPGTFPGASPYDNWWDWPPNAISYLTSGGSGCTFDQDKSGLLDTYRDRVRFGLMTFDSLTDPGIGTSGNNPDSATGNAGSWSYFPNWITSSSYAVGKPLACLTAAPAVEVGARNAAAPPWEGRLISFGSPTATIAQTHTQNDRIQEAILAMRPFGATPIAGMLTDAQELIYNDTQLDKTTNAEYGAKNDPYWTNGCRQSFVILLSDGEPNLDLRPDCQDNPVGAANTSGDLNCPFKPAWYVAQTMATDPTPAKRVKTFVVGLGVNPAVPGPGVDCTTLTSAQILNLAPLPAPAVGLCSAQTGNLKACCELGRIAYEGGTTNAYFANNVAQLRQAISTILNGITAGTTSRTQPVFASVPANTAYVGLAPAASYQFVSSVGTSGQVDTGNLERKRYRCDAALNISIDNVTQALGDDFAYNLNKEGGAHPRTFFTAFEAGTNASKATLRPASGADAPLGARTGTMTNAGPAGRGPFVGAVTPGSMGITGTPSACKSFFGVATNATTCAADVLAWHTGDPAANPSRNAFSANCPAPGPCSDLGGILHSTPRIVGLPSDFLRDESYAYFATLPAVAKRPTTLYTATIDGQLHAFKVAPNDPTDTFRIDDKLNNEIWSFFPPYVLSSLLSSYSQQAVLLDGPPIIKDVVFQRDQATAIVGGGAGGAQWRTVLVAGGGAGGGFYYALDVTDPYNPKFLWQIAQDSAGNSIFGDTVPSPAIATVKVGPKEVAVAILPGGSEPLKGGHQNRKQGTWPFIQPTSASYGVRPKVHDWGKGPSMPGRSVTVVRLDDGTVLRRFQQKNQDGPTFPAVSDPIDSPMTGVPVPFPADVGAISSRAFIGDADGTLWRINFADTNPANWTIDMTWDAYAFSSDDETTGQPIATPPIVTIDSSGNPIVLFSTGDQDNLGSNTEENRVWSITEKPSGVNYITSENWLMPFTNGVRVTGPMALFNGQLYFATFTPIPVDSTCTDGYGSLWAVDFVQSAPKSAPLWSVGGNGPYTVNFPLARLAINPANLALGYKFYEDMAKGEVLYGVSVTQQPTCTATATYTDAYFGGASFTSINASNGGNFQVVFSTGKKGSAQNGSVTKTDVRDLPRPRQTTRIDSWAAIVE
jgi:type IV pilus assembly protein PilY1